MNKNSDVTSFCYKTTFIENCTKQDTHVKEEKERSSYKSLIDKYSIILKKWLLCLLDKLSFSEFGLLDSFDTFWILDDIFIEH